MLTPLSEINEINNLLDWFWLGTSKGRRFAAAEKAFYADKVKRVGKVIERIRSFEYHNLNSCKFHMRRAVLNFNRHEI
jgi:hypothetical protein